MGSASDNSTKICKKCSENIAKGVKCVNCEGFYHSSCARKQNVKILGDSLVECCNNITQEPDNHHSDDMFFDAIDKLSGNEKKVDIAIFQYIIKQKNNIISELNDKIRILKQYIDMMEYNNKMSTDNISTKRESSVMGELKPFNSGKQIPNSNKVNQKMKSLDTKKTQKNKPTEKDGKVFSEPVVFAAIEQAKISTKASEYINLVNDDQSLVAAHPPSTSSNSKYNSFRSSRRQVVVGKNRGVTTVKGVPKYAELHVYRLRPDTTEVQLMNCMKDHFPEIECSALNSKHPELYSSFKVKISAFNFSRAMDPEIWPEGACISRFLSKRVKETPKN